MTKPLLYIDLEGPGVPDGATTSDVAKQRIFEIGAILMTADLSEELGRFETVVRPTPASIIELQSHPYVLDMHKLSGLYEILTSPEAQNLPTLHEAEDGVLALLDRFGVDKAIISGTGVARYDRPQIQEQMPRLAARLTYDEQDISSARKRYEQIVGTPIVPAKPMKSHRAIQDLEDDIRYQRAFDGLYAAQVPAKTVSPLERQLLALAITEQFMEHDVFENADGVLISTVRPPKVAAELLEGIAPLDVIGGYMSLCEQLLRLLASQTGMRPQVAVEVIRESLLEAAPTI